MLVPRRVLRLVVAAVFAAVIAGVGLALARLRRRDRVALRGAAHFLRRRREEPRERQRQGAAHEREQEDEGRVVRVEEGEVELREKRAPEAVERLGEPEHAAAVPREVAGGRGHRRGVDVASAVAPHEAAHGGEREVQGPLARRVGHDEPEAKVAGADDDAAGGGRESGPVAVVYHAGKRHVVARVGGEGAPIEVGLREAHLRGLERAAVDTVGVYGAADELQTPARE
mmetsp:Transcript_35588/g.111890  ORF Transcript_35588/g.111890 Transcript_35588/m.111890 type:complete len:228 (+) Transcript_35588:1187-1870(+)